MSNGLFASHITFVPMPTKLASCLSVSKAICRAPAAYSIRLLPDCFCLGLRKLTISRVSKCLGNYIRYYILLLLYANAPKSEPSVIYVSGASEVHRRHSVQPSSDKCHQYFFEQHIAHSIEHIRCPLAKGIVSVCTFAVSSYQLATAVHSSQHDFLAFASGLLFIASMTMLALREFQAVKCKCEMKITSAFRNV